MAQAGEVMYTVSLDKSDGTREEHLVPQANLLAVLARMQRDILASSGEGFTLSVIRKSPVIVS